MGVNFLNPDSESAIMLALTNVEELPLGILVEILKSKGFDDDSQIKGAIWRLIDQKKIEMTPQRTLRSPRASL